MNKRRNPFRIKCQVVPQNMSKQDIPKAPKADYPTLK